MNNTDLFKQMEVEGSYLQANQSLGAVLMEYIKVLFRRKWLILICTLIVFIPATIWISNITPIYQAEASFIYDEAQDTAFLLDFGQNFYSKSAIVNMIEQVKSRSLAEKVVKSLPEEVLQTFKVPEDLSDEQSRNRYLARLIKGNLEITNVRGGDIIKISAIANDPNAVKIIVNSYIDNIVNWSQQKNKEEISNIRNFVEGQLSIFQDNLRAAEEDLLKFKEENDFITLSDASSAVLENLTETEVEYNQVKTQREALEQRRRFIEQKMQELLPSLAVSGNNSIAQQLKEELVRLETQYSSLQQKAGPEDEKNMASIRADINHTKQQLINELMRHAIQENLVDPLAQIRGMLQESITIEAELQALKPREQALQNSLDAYSAELSVLPKQELELARLIRAKEVNDKIFTILLERREEARITEAGKIGYVRVIDYAEAPKYPIKPNKKKMFTMALALGLALGIGLTLFLNSLDDSLKSEQDVEKYLNVPVVASIPKISSNGVLHKIGKKEITENSYSPKLLSHMVAKSHIIEAYRSLQLNLSFLNPDKKLKTILITSAAPGEGKTLTTLNIAQMYARAGTKTLIIDCDLRRPMVHKALKIRQEPGLTNLLIDKSATLDSCVQVFDDEHLNGNLAILTSGAIPPNPAELLSSKSMQDLLTKARNVYELIFIDAPPVISVSDSVILGQKVDGVLLVLRSGKINREAAQKAKKILENGKISIGGSLLNDVDYKNVYGYYKDYYYYSDKDKKKTMS